MLRLRGFELDDIPDLLSWVNSEHAMVQWAGLNFRWPLEYAQLAAYHAQTQGSSSTVRAWTVMSTLTGESIGHTALSNILPAHGLATVSRVLIAPAHRRRGFCVPMIREVLRIGFEALALRRINLAVFDFNVPGIQCYEKCGFVHEGVWREFAQVGDGTWNIMWMSILKHEWVAQEKR